MYKCFKILEENFPIIALMNVIDEHFNVCVKKFCLILACNLTQILLLFHLKCTQKFYILIDLP